MNFDLFGIYLAGILTFVTPCVIPVIPVYMSILIGTSVEKGVKVRLALIFNTILFISGFLIVFVLLGLGVTALGSLLIEYKKEMMILGGLVIFLFGLKFIGYLKIDVLEREARPEGSRFLTKYLSVNAFLLGFLFALGWTPCVGPVLGSVLTYTASQTSDPVKGAFYLAVYGLGFGTPLIAAAFIGEVLRKGVSRMSKWLPKIQRLTGVLIAAVGVAIMLSSSAVPSGGRVESVGEKSSPSGDVKLSEKIRKPMMVEFYSPDCPVCVKMMPVISIIENDCQGKNVEIVKIDVSLAENKPLISKYRIRGVPTFLFIESDGKESARLVGFQPPETLRQALALLTGEECKGLGLLPELPLNEDENQQCGDQGNCPL